MPDHGKFRTISVLIPVLNEQRGIKEFISKARRAFAGTEARFVIADGDPSGSTIAALREEEAEANDLQLLITPAGRARQMNRAAAEASGDVFIFLHADTILPEGAGRAVLDLLNQGMADAGAFDLEFDSDRPMLRFIAWCARIRSRLTRIPFGDQAQFIRADLFRDMGGHADIPLMEDVDLFRRLRTTGRPVGILPLRARTSARRYEQEFPLLRSVKNLTLRLLYAIGVPPQKLAAMYRPNQ